MNIPRYAVIGQPVTHSLSPKIHHYFAQQMQIALVYEKIQGEEQRFEEQVLDFFAQGGSGLNITSPFKQRAYQLSEHQTLRCRKAGAANTLWRSNNQLYADNTDGIGLVRDLGHYLEIRGKNILILGAGGAARGIIAPLLALKPHQLMVANRSVERARELQRDEPSITCCALPELSGQFDLIINATSAGLQGQSIDLSKEIMEHKPFCYDLTYQRNKETSFVHFARNFGCDATDGLGMLVEQAAESFFIWHGIMIPDFVREALVSLDRFAAY